MPVQLDLLTRVRNIRWASGGGRFVACGQGGGGSGGIFEYSFPALRFFTRMQGKTKPYPPWIETKVLFDVPTDFGGNILCNFRASAYGRPGTTPVFVIGGQGVAFLGARSGAYIQTSNDGQTWSTTFSYYTSTFAYIYAMTWDKSDGHFYAAMVHSPAIGVQNEVLLRSADGRNWAEVGRQVVEGGVKYTSLLEPHCDPRVKNASNQPLPSGIYGYDEIKKTLIAPYPTRHWHFTGNEDFEEDPGPQIQIQTEDDAGIKHTRIKTLSGFSRVNAVGYAGGIWQAVGDTEGEENQTGIIATSTDDGETWSKAYSPDTKYHFINSIVGALSTHFAG